MSRHRIVRTMDYSEDYDGYDDVYGHSVDDESCISPTDASQWMYDRARGQQSMSAFVANNSNIEEEDEDSGQLEEFKMPNLNDNDRARLLSCMEEIRNVVGEAFSEKHMVAIVLKHDFDFSKSLDEILNTPETPVVTTSSAAKVEIDKGPPSKFFEQFKHSSSNVHTTTSTPTVIVTAISNTFSPIVTSNVDSPSVRKGFDTSISHSPSTRSPVRSRRNSIEMDVDVKSLGNAMQRTKDQCNRDASTMYVGERGDEKQSIHMVVIGHVDAGKSTLMGHTLYDLGAVNQRSMHKYEQESRKIGKQSFMYAWVLDETTEERERGITMDVGSTRFETDTKIVTLLDAPGHKDFIPNMISGATQADVALLVVDATRGEFETGFEQGGQTREHAVLVRSLGVSQLGVVVNKLDTVNWSCERFDEIVAKLKVFLRQAGFKESDIKYVPCSGLTGENLVKAPTAPELLAWYKGPTLSNIIDNFRTPERSLDYPFRMTISDIYKGTGIGLCVSGRIETGALCPTDRVLLCPLKEQAVVKSVAIDEMSRPAVFAGDHVSVTLSGVDLLNVSVGSMLCDIAMPVPITSRVQARIVLFSLRVPITIGSPVLLHHQALVEAATIVKLKAQLHKQTGEIIKKNPRCLGSNTCALVEIETVKPICIERYADCKELGRVMLRIGGVTVAAGLVTKILK